MKKYTTCFVALLLLSMSNAQAALIATYDFVAANSQSPISPSMVAADFSASSLTVQGVTGNGFSNHYYFNGWDQTVNLGKFYQASISSTGPFILENTTFSMENTGGNSQFFMRSSLDGFTADIGASSFFNGLVTNFDIDLSSLGVLSSKITFRWYVTSSSTAGFANHQPGGAGGGLADAGIDLSFFGSVAEVSSPTTVALLGLGLFGLSLTRRKK